MPEITDSKLQSEEEEAGHKQKRHGGVQERGDGVEADSEPIDTFIPILFLGMSGKRSDTRNLL